MVDTAMQNLYGGWDNVDEAIKDLFVSILSQYEHDAELYSKVQADERTTKQTLQFIASKYEDVVREDTIKEIIKSNQKTKDVFKISDTAEDQSLVKALDELLREESEREF